MNNIIIDLFTGDGKDGREVNRQWKKRRPNRVRVVDAKLWKN